ncbi:MAG: polysaccharide deacetylase family protein [Planctomycetota bacterium]
MNAGPASCCLKVDVDTHDGMRDGVPHLLDIFAAARVKATFFLSFGPDNAGKAIWNVLRKRGFLRKMLLTHAPRLYGWRTVLSGTLLPARMIAAKFAEVVRRIEQEGHEVGVHCWDHRLWQDHLHTMDASAIEAQFRRAFDSYQAVLGHAPRAVAAPAWYATPASLRVQDSLGLLYASDMRGGRPGFPRFEGYESTTLQIPSTQPCLEELLATGRRDPREWVDLVLQPLPAADPMVIPVHAEVEGGLYRSFMVELLRAIARTARAVRTLEEVARELLARDSPPPRFTVRLAAIPGRSGHVLTPADAPSGAC